jgi:hypothetical protein
MKNDVYGLWNFPKGTLVMLIYAGKGEHPDWHVEAIESKKSISWIPESAMERVTSVSELVGRGN